MNNQRLISFDIQADFGFFKKPDYNDGVLLTYNMLHKPALLGILGAIIGLRGYRKKGEWPEYYQRLAALPVGIEPLEGRHEKGNFQKTIVKYTNTVGYANQDGNLLVEESMLIIRPIAAIFCCRKSIRITGSCTSISGKDGPSIFPIWVKMNIRPGSEIRSGNMLLKLLYRKLISGFHPCLSKKEY